MKDIQCDRFKQRLESRKAVKFSIRKDGKIRFRNKMFVPEGNGLQKELFKEAHQGPFSLHLGRIKMHCDLKASYWWPGMNKEIAEYVSTCLTCQRVKAKRQVPSGKLYPLEIQEWKWDRITMDFVSGLPLSPFKKNYV